MTERENYTVEIFLDLDADGFAHAEAVLIAERHEPVIARGSCRGRGADPRRSSSDFRAIVAGALSDLARTLAGAAPEPGGALAPAAAPNRPPLP